MLKASAGRNDTMAAHKSRAGLEIQLRYRDSIPIAAKLGIDIVSPYPPLGFQSDDFRLGC
jgi:hypothetical protein